MVSIASCCESLGGLLEAQILVQERAIVVDDQNPRALNKAGRTNADQRPFAQRRLSDDVQPAGRQCSIDG
jgi:hypothetical protein